MAHAQLCMTKGMQCFHSHQPPRLLAHGSKARDSYISTEADRG